MSKIGATSVQQQKRQRGKKTVEPHTTTFAVTHIRLLEANPGKLAALDALAPVFLSLCQQYVTLFCTSEQPDPFHPRNCAHAWKSRARSRFPPPAVKAVSVSSGM